MDLKDQKKITRNMLKIRNALEKDVLGVSKKLVENNALTKHAYESIRNVQPRVPYLQCGMLINKLLRGGPDAFEQFKKVIIQRGYRKLAEHLDDDCAYENAKEPTRSRESTFVIPSPRVQETASEKVLNSSHRTTTPCADIDEVRQLEKMMTFVLTNFDERDINSKRVNFRKDICLPCVEETSENTERLGVYKNLHFKNISLTNQNLVH